MINTTDNLQYQFNFLILLTFILFLSTQFLTHLPNDWFSGGLYSWVYTDWLIDYSAGFVRRGLSGELVYAVSDFIHPYHFSVILSWSIFLILVVGYLYLVFKNLKKIPPLYLIIILFLPSLLPFYVFDHSALGRKEMLGYIFLFIHLFLIKWQFSLSPFNKNTYIKFLALITFLFLPLHILIHESSLLLFIPVHIMMSWTVLSYHENHHFYKKLKVLMLMYSPVFITFLIVYALGRPELEVVQKICTHWEALHALRQGTCQIDNENTMWTLPGALSALAWNFSQATSLAASLSIYIIFGWLFIFLLLSFISMAYLGQLSTLLSLDENKQSPLVEQTNQWKHSTLIRFKYFLIPILCSLPLYLVGWDFGRWFAVTSINFAIIVLSKELGYMEAKILPMNNSFFKQLTRMTNIITISRTKISHVLTPTFILIILFYLRLPHCCISENFEFVAQPLREFLQFMAK